MPTDERRLTRLRAGLVKPDEVTADDLQLLGINAVTTIGQRSTNSNGHASGFVTFDPPSPWLNPEEQMIANEEAAEREKVIASLPPAALTPRTGNYGKATKPVRDVDTGETWPSATIAAEALGIVISNLTSSIRKGRAVKGRKLEYMPKEPAL